MSLCQRPLLHHTAVCAGHGRQSCRRHAALIVSGDCIRKLEAGWDEGVQGGMLQTTRWAGGGTGPIHSLRIAVACLACLQTQWDAFTLLWGCTSAVATHHFEACATGPVMRYRSTLGQWVPDTPCARHLAKRGMGEIAFPMPYMQRAQLFSPYEQAEPRPIIEALQAF